MTAEDDALSLTEFRELLEEFQRLNALDGRRASATLVPRDLQSQIAQCRAQLNRSVEHARGLVEQAVTVSPLEDVWNGTFVDPFAAIFRDARLIPDVVDLLNRAIGVYERGGRRAPPSPSTTAAVNVSFVTDSDLRAVLERNAQELVIAMDHSAWTAAVVLAGAIAEGALFFLLSNREADARAAIPAVVARNSGRTIAGPIERWSLWAYIEVADELNVLEATTSRIAHDVLRDFRNMVHPRVQIADGLTPTSQVARASVAYLEALLIDVAAAI